MSKEELPARIGKYKIQRLLGEGAMGVVYDALDETIDRRVAVKTLHSHLLTKKHGQEFLERFKREAISAARCVHTNIVLVLEYGEDNNIPFIAMEYVDGISLEDLLKSKKKINLKSILTIVSQLLKAIHAAHALGVIHRDIKLANIMLSKKDNSVKLADFGIARLVENNSMTLTGAVIGTPRYMAPEQMFGLKVDERADLFSIAMVFSDLLVNMSSHSAIASSQLPSLELPQNNRINYSHTYPNALIPVLQKGLAVKADDRFQTAKEFAAALQKSLAELKRKKPLAEEATQIVNPVQSGTDIYNEDLDSLTQVLTDYIGPVAKNVMQEQKAQCTSLNDLMTAVAQEIPEESQRKAFVQDWEKKSNSGGRSQISDSHFNTSRSGTGMQSTRGSSIRLDENMIQKISNDYVNYVGPFAPRLVDHFCVESSDKEQFLQNLANEIPEQKDRDEFLKRWSLA